MVNKDLVKWITRGEAKGYTKEELKKYLLKNGYDEKEVEEAIERAPYSKITFSLFKYIKSISLPVFIAFILSFFFLAYAFNRMTEGVVFLSVLIGLSLIIEYLHNKGERALAEGITIATLVILYIILSFYERLRFSNYQFLYVCLVFVFIVLHALIYFFRLEKKHSLISLFLNFFISFTFAFTLTFLGYLFYAYVLSVAIRNVSLLNLILVLTFLFALFVASYIWISSKLLKLTKESDIPDKRTLNKVIFKYTLIFSIIFLVGAFAYVSILGMRFENQAFSSLIILNKGVSNQIQKVFIHSNKVKLQARGFNNFTYMSKIILNNGRVAYLPFSHEMQNVSFVLFNCDENFNCQKKRFNFSQRLENQVPLNDDCFILLANNKTGKYLFLLPCRSSEEIISNGLGYFDENLSKNFSILTEMNNQLKTDYDNAFTNESIPYEIFSNKLNFLYSDKTLKAFFNKLMLHRKFTITFDKYDYLEQVTFREYNKIQENELNNKTFYDGTKDLDEHIQKLQTVVDEFYQNISNINTKGDKREYYSYTLALLRNDSLFDEATSKIVRHLNLYKTMQEYIKDSEDPRKTNEQEELDEISKEYSELNNSNNKIDKALRLKILEAEMLKVLERSCTDYNNKLKIVSLTQDPYLCQYSYFNRLDEQGCILNLSKYDKDMCEKIDNDELRKKCLNS